MAARASSFAFKGKPLDVGQVSRALNVGAVLDGERTSLGQAAAGHGRACGRARWQPSLGGQLRPRASRRLPGAGRARARHRGRAPGSAPACGKIRHHHRAGRNAGPSRRMTSTSRGAFSGTSVPTSHCSGPPTSSSAQQREIRPTLRPTQGWPTPTSSCHSTAQYGRATRSPRPDGRSSER